MIDVLVDMASDLVETLVEICLEVLTQMVRKAQPMAGGCSASSKGVFSQWQDGGKCYTVGIRSVILDISSVILKGLCTKTGVLGSFSSQASSRLFVSCDFLKRSLPILRFAKALFREMSFVFEQMNMTVSSLLLRSNSWLKDWSRNSWAVFLLQLQQPEQYSSSGSWIVIISI